MDENMEHVKGQSDMDQISVNSYQAAVHKNRRSRVVSPPATPATGPCGLSENAFKMLVGIVLVIAIAVSWVGATQFAESTYSATFSAPYFTTWFSTIWMIVCFPILSIVRILQGKSFIETYRESEKIYGSRGLCLISVLKIALPFCMCWMVANFLYIYALGLILPADVTAIFSSTSAFVYVFSLIWLKESFMILRAIATAISIVGIILFAYSQGFGGFQLLGVMLTVGASVAASLYKVWLKRVVGNATFDQIGLFLTILGLLALLILWPIILILYFTKAEKIEWDNLPITFLCGSAALGLVFNFLVNFGIAFTFPLFISLGTLIGIPLNAIADAIFRQREFGPIKIGGSVCITVGFLIMLISDEKSKQISDGIMYILFCGRSAQVYGLWKRISDRIWRIVLYCWRSVRCRQGSNESGKGDDIDSINDIPKKVDANGHSKCESGTNA